MASKESTIGNIGVRESARLRTVGLAGLVGGLGLGILAISGQAAWWIRPALFVVIWVGVSALLQARQRTSVLLAARRVRRIDGKEERERYVLTLTARARKIQRRSLLVAVLFVTVVALIR